MYTTIPVSRSIWILFLLVALCKATFALESDRTIAQYVHTAWSQKEGAPSGILALAQTADGFLWVGGVDGLYRFDGVTFELRSRGTIFALLALPNGDLWIGRRSAVSLLRNGQTTNFTVSDGVPEGKAASFAQDGEGTMWMATNAGLARLEGKRWKQVGASWNFNEVYATGMLLDRQGTFWVAAGHTILSLPRGSHRFQTSGINVGQVWTLAEAPNGKLWMSETTRAVRPVPLGGDLSPSDKTEFAVGSIGILFDRDGSLWISSLGEGVRRVPFPEKVAGRKFEAKDTTMESFTAADGLTDNLVTSIMQDREGNVWVGTNNGLDRFYKSKVVPVNLPFPVIMPTMAAGESGSVWVSSVNQNFQIGRRSDKSQIQSTDRVTIEPTRAQYLSAYRAPDGSLWWSRSGLIDRIKPGSSDWSRVQRILTPMDEATRTEQQFQITEDRNGVIWAVSDTGRVYSFRDSHWNRMDAIAVSRGHRGTAAFTDSAGRVWLGFADGRVILLEDETVKKTWSGRDSLVGKGVAAITGRGSHIWLGGDKLVYLDGENFCEVTPADAHSFETWGIEETQDSDLWLSESRGVIHIPSAEVDSFLKNHAYRVQYELYNSLEGLPGSFRDAYLHSPEIQGTDGRIWFSTTKGIAWVNPALISRNMLPPPVVIRSMKADGKEYPATAVTYPPLATALEIDYTALSLSIPERLQFRYKLEGVDKDWEVVGTRRSAFYTKLGPGKYHFQVIARNNDGVWNEAGAHLYFEIAPTWYQTSWFRLACVGTLLLLVWGLYQFRVQKLRGHFRVLLEARVNERTRIARELHDTLLQSLHGLMFEFQAARNLFRKHPEEALQALDNAISGTEQAITESQDAIENLRTAATPEANLAQQIKIIGEELVSSRHCDDESPTFGLTVEGHQRALAPVMLDEAFYIAREALRNAFRHAQAHRIEAEILYGEDELRIRVRDDGKGMAPEILEEGRRPGHWGLPGIRERAERIGAKLDIWSQAGVGTEVQLSVSATVAYQKMSPRSKLRAFQRTKNHGHRP